MTFNGETATEFDSFTGLLGHSGGG